MRYWDGLAWSDHYADRYAYAPPKKRRAWLWIVPTVLVLGLGGLVLLIAVVAVSDGTSTKAAPSDPAEYAVISKRDFAQVVKNPNDHDGERYIIYAEVTQFDSATGTTEFRADVFAESPRGAFVFGENAIVGTHDAAMFEDIVQRDRLKIWIEVRGSETYDTQIGGSSTVPRFAAGIVEVTRPAN